MKKVVVLLMSLLSITSSFAGSMRATGMTMVAPGHFKMDLGVGIPGWDGIKAVMPMVTLDGAWGLASGFIHSKHFGNNGGVDLGFQYGICGYNKFRDKKLNIRGGALQNMVLLRSAFHYQWVTKLDTYAGFHGGVNISTPTGDWGDNEKAGWDHANGIFGMYFGAKWFFTDVFGLMLEFEGDFLYSNTPNLSVGCSWKF